MRYFKILFPKIKGKETIIPNHAPLELTRLNARTIVELNKKIIKDLVLCFFYLYLIIKAKLKGKIKESQTPV